MKLPTIGNFPKLSCTLTFIPPPSYCTQSVATPNNLLHLAAILSPCFSENMIPGSVSPRRPSRDKRVSDRWPVLIRPEYPVLPHMSFGLSFCGLCVKFTQTASNTYACWRAFKSSTQSRRRGSTPVRNSLAGRETLWRRTRRLSSDVGRRYLHSTSVPS
ncbi:hypothetical protein KQX54_005290 [Cotesia glomerata]|uniref:Uncharacterized protein n=1 Tax=Cotesia glomerata TaxID=32391 RepID=A0AAV7J688_COTGL|nr:hypothetical protein KQX54_005290 [Cotesia glomerata]